MKLLKLLFAVLLLWPALARCQVTNTLQTMGITNYSGHLIASDAANTNAAYNREAIYVRSIVRSSNTTAIVTAYDFYVSCRLLDTNNTAKLLTLTNGGTGTALNITNSGLNIPGNSSILTTNIAAIQPAARLDPSNRYSVELTLYRAGTYLGVLTNDGSRSYWHFTNTVNADAAFNALATLNSVSMVRTSAVSTVSGRNYFSADAAFTLKRYDAFTNAAPDSTNVSVVIDYQLHNVTSNTFIPLLASRTNITVPIASYAAGTPRAPASVTATQTLVLQPAGQLDSVSNVFRVLATVSWTNQTGQAAVAGNSLGTASKRLLHFNGTLTFGAAPAIQTTFTNLASDPTLVSVQPTYLRANLAVSGQSGTVNGTPGFTHGTGAALDVRLLPNGTAELNSGSVTLTGPVPDSDSLNNVRFKRGPVTLDTTGARADLTVFLPTGLGYNSGGFENHILTGTFPFGAAALNQSLDPSVGTFTYSPGTMFVTEESKPLRFECSGFTWATTSGTFTLNSLGRVSFVRGAEFMSLSNAAAAGQLVNPAWGDKKSNDRYYLHLNTNLVTGNPLVRAAADGSARLDAATGLFPGKFTPHFPYGADVTWASPSPMNFTNDQFFTNSQLVGVSTLTVPYSRDCDGCGTGAGSISPAIALNGAVLNFTVDGGLVGQGPVTTNAALHWGYFSSGVTTGFAQAVSIFSTGRFHMPGDFMRGDQVTLNGDHRAAALLYSGMTATNLSYIERPDLGATANYTRYLAGYADYAGLNFSVGSASMTATSKLATVPAGPWTPTSRSKYYTRQAGVSGIHEALTGTFPSNSTLYGYNFIITNYGLSYLDSQNLDSRTKGNVYVPYPSVFTQAFDRLTFTCPGGLDQATVPSGDPMKRLNYWSGDFSTLAISFETPGATCDPGTAYLVLGVEAWSGPITNALYGSVGFRPNGTIIPNDGTLPNFNSRLKTPVPAYISGDSSNVYAFTAVADAYFNDYSNAYPSIAGWMNIVGGLDVPFFEDVKVHAHTTAKMGDTNATIHMMGGWPRKEGTGSYTNSWSDGTNNFWNYSIFDATNTGFPVASALTTYHDGSTEIYNPRAQRSWLEVVEFDYPLLWTNSLRAFGGLVPVSNNFLIVRTSHQLQGLSASQADIKFGLQYGNIPGLNLSEMLTGTNSLLYQLLTNALGQAETDAINAANGAMEEFLSANLGTLMDPVFKQTIDPTLGSFYRYFSNEYHSVIATNLTTNRQVLLMALATNYINTYFWGAGGGTPTNIYSLILSAGEAATNGIGMLQKLTTNLNLTHQGLTNIIPFLEKNTNGERQVVKTLCDLYVGKKVPEIATTVGDKLTGFIKKHDAEFEQLHVTLTNIDAAVVEMRKQVTNTTGLFVEFTNKLASATNDIGLAVSNGMWLVTNSLAQADASFEDPFQLYTEAEFVNAIHRGIVDEFLAKQVAAELTGILKERLYDLDAEMRETIDSMFGQVNAVLRELIGEQLAELDKEIAGMLDDVNGVIGAGSIDGYAHINGDTLTEARLDLKAQLKVPDAMELKAYIQIRELNSDTGAGCYGASSSATEVKFGAIDVPILWISTGMTASAGMKFAFDTSAGVKLVGVGGSFELKGGPKFESFECTYLGAAIGFGKAENYLSAAAGVKFESYAAFGGLFFGRTCTIDPIKMWDPFVAEILGDGQFTGAYGYGECSFPLNQVIGVPSSCMFDITATIGLGVGYFVEGPTYLGKMKLGASGQVLCIAEGSAEITMAGVKKGDDFSFKGQGIIEGEAGKCPVCLKGKLTVDLKYDKANGWDVDF